MALSLARDFVLLAPLCILLPMRFGVVGPLYSAPIADVICLVITVCVVAYTFKGMDENRSPVQIHSFENQMD
jgi:hypothetical protein